MTQNNSYDKIILENRGGKMIMKKGNAGFTLIELLAVIVVLAIVSVIGTVTVLPALSNVRENSFATEVNEFKKAGSDAVSLIMLDNEDAISAAKKVTDGYCFTFADLVNLGLFEKDINGGYAGTVIATKASGANVYSYKVSLTNGNKFYAYTEGSFDAEGIKDSAEAAGADYTETCPTE